MESVPSFCMYKINLCKLANSYPYPVYQHSLFFFHCTALCTTQCRVPIEFIVMECLMCLNMTLVMTMILYPVLARSGAKSSKN